MSAAEPAGVGPTRPLGTVLADLQPAGDGSLTLSAPPDWAQGRTLYGGLAAALCLRAAQSTIGDLGPLRSLQVAFLGPMQGQLTFRARLRRGGRSVSFVGVDADAGAAAGVAALMMFGHPRPIELAHQRLAAPAVPGLEHCPEFSSSSPGGPAFLTHMELRFAAGSPPFSGGTPESVMWARHINGGGLSVEEAIVGIADALAPAVLSASDRPRPGSSVTWSLDLLAADAEPDGWFLLHSSSDAAAGGYSHQTMTCFSADGRPLAAGRQTVAVY